MVGFLRRASGAKARTDANDSRGTTLATAALVDVVSAVIRGIVWPLVVRILIGTRITDIVAARITAVAVVGFAVAVTWLAVTIIAGRVARVSDASTQRGRQQECCDRDQPASSRCELRVSHDVILAFIDTHTA